MIVEFPDFESKNSLADVAAGTYIVVESLYLSARTSGCQAIVSELLRADPQRRVGVDLQITLADGLVLFRDFARAHDGAWRNSYGAKANALEDLLPPELARFRLARRMCTVVEHDGQGTLVVVRVPGAIDGP